jgi:hypothetical protein
VHFVYSGNQRLLKISGSCLQCAIQTHRLLLKVAHLIPENFLIGQQDLVPGITVTKGKDSGGHDFVILF